MSHGERRGGGWRRTERGNVNYPYILAKACYINVSGFLLNKCSREVVEGPQKLWELYVPSGGHKTKYN